jgi:hypothetical protein
MRRRIGVLYGKRGEKVTQLVIEIIFWGCCSSLLLRGEMSGLVLGCIFDDKTSVSAKRNITSEGRESWERQRSRERERERSRERERETEGGGEVDLHQILFD